MAEKLTNTKTGAVIGTISGNIVTTATGDKYKVSSGDIQWLKDKQNKGLRVGDITAVGTLVNNKKADDAKGSVGVRANEAADAWNGMNAHGAKDSNFTVSVIQKLESIIHAVEEGIDGKNKNLFSLARKRIIETESYFQQQKGKVPNEELTRMTERFERTKERALSKMK